MKRLALLLVLPLASCVGDRTCRVEYSGQVLLAMEPDRPVPLQGPYEVWDAFDDLLGDDCQEPDCNVIGDSLFYLQRVRGFAGVVSESGRSLDGCSVIVTRGCTYDVDTRAGTLAARRECGPDFNLGEYEG